MACTLYISRHTVVCHVAQEAGPCNTMSIMQELYMLCNIKSIKVTIYSNGTSKFLGNEKLMQTHSSKVLGHNLLGSSSSLFYLCTVSYHTV